MGAKNTSKAQDRLISCEKCDDLVITPFKLLLEELARKYGIREYTLPEQVTCPVCSGVIVESTLVSFRKEVESTSGADYFDPLLENSSVWLVDEPIRAAAESMISGCEHCADCTEISFEYILDQITGCDPTSTQYLLCRPARCPRCSRDVTERTLVLQREILR